MTPESSSTDVVIVGSGPTGLMAAALLVRCGVKVRILDKSQQQAHESRAFGVQPKSIELLLNMGLADEFLKRGFIATGAQIFVDGKQAGQLNLDDIGRSDTPYSFLLMVPQWDIEAILVDDLKRHGVEVEHNAEVTGFTQSAAGVVVQAKDESGTTHELKAAYVIGADGAHSIVRKTLGLRYEGAAYPQLFLLADCKIKWDLDYDHLKFFARGRNLVIYLPLQGQDLCRIVAVKPLGSAATAATAEAGGAEPATLAEVQQVVSAATGLDITLSDPQWVSGYRIHHRGVNKYGEGRAFVAGDAAHIHSPAGGQGMNTGLQDAANLAWKLALVLKGHAPQSLLETYNSERWPVGQKVLHYTDRLFAAVSSQSGWAAALRNMILPLFAQAVSHSGMLRAKAFHFISQLGIRYHGNEFLHDDLSADASRAWREGLTAGHRAPDGQIARNLDLFSLIDGYRFHALALSRTPLTRAEIEQLSAEMATLPRSVGLELKSHIVAHSLLGRDERIVRSENNQVFNNYGLTHDVPRALLLIRPDGYIAYRSDRLDVAGLKTFLQRFAGSRAD